MPSPLLEMLGADPQRTETPTAAGGAEEERSLAEVKFRIEDRERTSRCVFSPVDSGLILGKHTPWTHLGYSWTNLRVS